jgi:ABC-2 type transport system ATP-binding protein
VENMIEIKNVSKTYKGKKKALDNVNLTINDGEIFGFIGHNGAGKTTMIKSIVGILDFESGDILINNKSIKSNPIECKMEMAYVPDNPDMYENMRAIDFINFVCDMYNISKNEREEKVLELARIFEIDDKLGNEINSFSHGMKQKVALIAALAHNPDILIMDEPFVGLDPKAVFDMKKIMHDMAKDGKTIFFSTHILDVAEKLCDRVAIIKDGKIVKIGKMKDIVSDESLEQVFLELGE